ncbi:cell division transport system permease protein [Thermonema lapsum]|uniref:Cell division protein FtsX n=1 Tax=Thermonema lapsum TaxID=28195 RepID=A0A846MMS7_9BACT|nr:permease-like cell division protein FtsX [Thermonema lapsum]NIK72745.1 cell division transport system permease protein [Thermonema lapsum]
MAVKEIKYKKKRLGSFPFLNVLLSVTIALFVLGLLGALILQAKRLAELVAQNIEVQVFLNSGVDEAERQKIEKIIAAKNYVDANSLRFISKEEAAKELIKELGEDFTEILGENPLKDSYALRIKSGFYDERKLKKIAEDLKKINGVFDVSYPQSIAAIINRNIATISFVLSSLALFLTITVVILIHSTIRLALFSQRLLIRSMQLVGATDAFVRRPFVRNAMLIGAVGGVLACALVYALLQYFIGQVPEIEMLMDYRLLGILGGSIVLFGALLCGFSCYHAVNKYLYSTLDELY